MAIAVAQSPASMPTRLRRALSATLIVVVSTLCGVVLWLLLDLLILSPFFLDPTLSIYDHDDYGWYTLTPNLKRAVGRWGRSAYAVSSDANGFRIDDSGPAPTAPADFVFLGDSFTFGVNGPWSDTFVGKFQRATGASVVNAGLSGYSPTVYLHQYRQALLSRRLAAKHAVVVGLDISDVLDEATRWEDGETHPRLRHWTMDKQAWAPMRSLAPRFLATWRIYRFVHYNVIEEALTKPHIFDRLRSAFTWRDWAEIEKSQPVNRPDEDEMLVYRPLGIAGGIERIRDKMRAIADLARQNGGELFILVYPWPAQLKYGEAVFDWEKFNADLCKEIACGGVINTFPQFRADANAHPDWYLRNFIENDIHLNEHGNAIVANALIGTFGAKANASIGEPKNF